jgi:hypothetical protein
LPWDSACGFRFCQNDPAAIGCSTSRDLFLAQRFARHLSPLTTTVYTHPSDEEMSTRIRLLTC